MGLGGGLLAVPALMLLFGTDLPTAEGTSLLMFFPNAIVGTITHARQGTADLRLGLNLNIGALPGAVAGVLIALALNVKILSIVFAVFAMTIGVREIYRMRRERVPRRERFVEIADLSSSEQTVFNNSTPIDQHATD